MNTTHLFAPPSDPAATAADLERLRAAVAEALLKAFRGSRILILSIEHLTPLTDAKMIKGEFIGAAYEKAEDDSWLLPTRIVTNQAWNALPDELRPIFTYALVEGYHYIIFARDAPTSTHFKVIQW